MEAGRVCRGPGHLRSNDVAHPVLLDPLGRFPLHIPEPRVRACVRVFVCVMLPISLVYVLIRHYRQLPQIKKRQSQAEGDTTQNRQIVF